MAFTDRLLLRVVIFLLPILYCFETSHLESYLQYRSVSYQISHGRSRTHCSGWWFGHRCREIQYTEYEQVYKSEPFTAYRCQFGWQWFPACNNAICNPACQSGFKCIRPNQCHDIDECDTNSHSCQHICINTPGKYHCACRRGYELQPNGQNCADINECTSDTSCEHFCVNTDGSFKCQCIRGYTLHEDGKTCTDIDECATKSHLCQQTCVNTLGTFHCGCRRGYELKADRRSCSDINECASKTHGCRHYCVNNDGSFTCHCVPGYTLHEDGKSCNATCDPSCGAGFRCTSPDHCTDVDECAKNSHLCHHVCQNTLGSYKCGCRGGHELQSDERTCKENRLLLEAEESNEVETDA